MEKNALYEHAVQVPHQVTENRENMIGTIKDKKSWRRSNYILETSY